MGGVHVEAERSRATLVALLSCAMATACAQHHVVEGERRADASVRDASADAPIFDRDVGFTPDVSVADAGPRDTGLRDGRYWRLERRGSFLSFPNEIGCFVDEGGTAVVRVDIPISHTCEYGGPVKVTLVPDGTRLVEAFVWVHHPVEESDGCFGVAAQESRFITAVVAADTYVVADELSGSRVEFTIPELDGPPCRETGSTGDECTRNCDCTFGLLCIPALGDFVECHGGVCGRACNRTGSDRPPVHGPDFDCDVSEQCSGSRGLASPICEGRGDDCAGPECGPGTVCRMGGVASGCDWELELNGVVRHVCGSDADCEAPGTVCVQHDSGMRRCETLCFTNQQRCPFMHICSPESGVCEWIGE